MKSKSTGTMNRGGCNRSRGAATASVDDMPFQSCVTSHRMAIESYLRREGKRKKKKEKLPAAKPYSAYTAACEQKVRMF